MAGNLYLGRVGDLQSNMGSMFGGQATPRVSGPQQIQQPGGIGSTGGQVAMASPHVTGPLQMQQGNIPQPQKTPGTTGSGPSYGGQYDPLAAQAVRPTSFGQMDTSYGQNLASAIGNSFQRPQQNQALQFNPYGDLTDANVQYPKLGGGNAPSLGLPQSMLQWSQMFNPASTSPPNTVNAAGQTVGGIIGTNAQGNPIYD